MNPALLWRIAPYLAAVLIVGGVLSGSYMTGYAHSSQHWKAISDQRDAVDAKADAKHAEELADARARVLAYERDQQAKMSAIDAQHQEDMRHAQIISERTIAGLRDGTLRLRDKFNTCQQSANSGVPKASASTGQRDGAKSIGLQQQDVEFLVRFASEADQVADQLRACQAVVRADRADAMGVSKP